MENKHILAKLAAVMVDVEYIQKDAKNTHQNYRYASERVIKERLHESFVKNKIVMQLNYGIPNQVGVVLFLPVEYVFWDVESGESLSGNCIGSGQTRDEKGLYAAITGAIKYILTGTFLIPTGDDAEKDDPKDVEAEKTPPRVSQAPHMGSGGVSDKQWGLITKLQNEHIVPEEIIADLSTWAAGSGQTSEDASRWIERLMACPKKPKDKPFDRQKTMEWIEREEKLVYMIVARVRARQKYMNCEILKDASDEALRAYAKHIKEKLDKDKADGTH